MSVMKIAVASGKGGTGKTTIATNLAQYVNNNSYRTVYLDCDVEEPMDICFSNLFLKRGSHLRFRFRY